MAFFLAIEPLLAAIGFLGDLRQGIPSVALARIGHIAVATEHAPDVVLMDIRMPVMDGIEATRRLPRQKVLILTTFGVDDYIIAALRAGASGLLLKDPPTTRRG